MASSSTRDSSDAIDAGQASGGSQSRVARADDGDIPGGPGSLVPGYWSLVPVSWPRNRGFWCRKRVPPIRVPVQYWYCSTPIEPIPNLVGTSVYTRVGDLLGRIVYAFPEIVAARGGRALGRRGGCDGSNDQRHAIRPRV